MPKQPQQPDITTVWLDEDDPPHVCFQCGKRGDVQIELFWNGVTLCFCYDHASQLAVLLTEET
jgi:hypothetical protein